MDIRQIKWSKENLADLVEKSRSKAEVLRKLGFEGYEGGNYRTLNKYLKIYNIDVSHFTGSGWNKNLVFVIRPKTPIQNLLVQNSSASTSTIKRRIIEEKILEYSCQKCSLNEWHGNFLSLHLDHINGDPTDNRRENLRFLCPNCHSQTPTYCVGHVRKNKARGIRTPNMRTLNTPPLPVGISPQTTCSFCKKPCSAKNKFCSSSCYHSSTRFENGGQHIGRRKVNRPTKEKLIEDLRNNSFCAVGRKYGVSDNAVRKWCKYFGIEM